MPAPSNSIACGRTPGSKAGPGTSPPVARDVGRIRTPRCTVRSSPDRHRAPRSTCRGRAAACSEACLATAEGRQRFTSRSRRAGHTFSGRSSCCATVTARQPDHEPPPPEHRCPRAPPRRRCMRRRSGRPAPALRRAACGRDRELAIDRAHVRLQPPRPCAGRIGHHDALLTEDPVARRSGDRRASS